MAAAEVVVVVAVISHAAIVVVLAEVDTAGAAVVEVAAEDLLEVVSVDLHLVLTIECLAMVKILTKIINERPKERIKRFVEIGKTNALEFSHRIFLQTLRNSAVFNLLFAIFLVFLFFLLITSYTS